MAHKKGQGSTRNGRDSRAQRLGVKKFGGEAVIPGNIIIRQCGTKWRPGRNVGLGSDYTIFALVEGKVVSVRDSGGTTYVNFGRRWTEDFTAVIPKRNERFLVSGLEPKRLEGRRIRLRGRLRDDSRRCRGRRRGRERGPIIRHQCTVASGPAIAGCPRTSATGRVPPPFIGTMVFGSTLAFPI